jgi:hypothetical protein
VRGLGAGNFAFSDYYSHPRECKHWIKRPKYIFKINNWILGKIDDASQIEI